MKLIKCLSVLLAAAFLSGCAVVDITKTAKGFHSPTDPNEIEIVKTRPARPFEELGDVSAFRFSARETAKMHNAIRAKSALLGADAVILTSEGIDRNNRRYALGVAIAWKD
jgi:hypothetical protein